MIWNNNLILNDKIRIPYSKENFFEFECIWDNSISIKFNPDKVDIKNLFAVIQSYLFNKNIRTIRLYSGFLYKENSKILSYSNITKIKHMNFISFCDWWENRLNQDKIYIDENEKELYSIIIVFSKLSLNDFIKENGIKKEDISSLKPIYPWKDEIINYFNYFK